MQRYLGRKWSPEQIAAVLRRDFPNRPEMHISHETICQAIYVQAAASSTESWPARCAPGAHCADPAARPSSPARR